MTSRDTYDILTYEEEKEESMNGINIQINTLVDAMIDAEKCLFHNSTANLMVNSLLDEVVLCLRTLRLGAIKEDNARFVISNHTDIANGYMSRCGTTTTSVLTEERLPVMAHEIKKMSC